MIAAAAVEETYRAITKFLLNNLPFEIFCNMPKQYHFQQYKCTITMSHQKSDEYLFSPFSG